MIKCLHLLEVENNGGQNKLSKGGKLMDKELAQYINTLLAEKEREVKSKQACFDKIDRSYER